MTRASRIASIVGAAFAWSLLGCNSILGIDTATLEPDAQGASGTSGSTSGVTGESGASGGSGTSGGSDAGADGGPLTLPYPQNYTISCDNYCNLIMEGCPPNPALFNMEYESADVCKQICTMGWEPTGAALDPSNEPMPLADTLACRVWHANAVIEGYPDNDPHTHCPHSGPLGGNHCDTGGTDYCMPFCRLELAFCTGDNAQYIVNPTDTMADQMNNCLAACEPDGGYPGYPYWIDPGGNTTTDLVAQGNTVNCRMYHLENAIATQNFTFHCPHTSLAGGGPDFCGGPIDAGM